MRIIRLLVVALLAGAATTVAAGPARAAACAAGTGVTVVVNSGVRCDVDGGGVAWSNFTDAGHSLEGTRRFANFVCRVDGRPSADDEACINTPPADAYWGLFWSDGTSGTWVYSSLGATSLKVPKGGSVALVFQNADGKTWPSVTPPVAKAPTKPTRTTAAPKPKPKPEPKTSATTRTAGPTSEPSGSAASATPTASDSPSPSASPSASPASPDASSSSPDAEATSASGEAVDTAMTAASDDDHGFPTGLVVGVVVIGAVAAAAVRAARHRRG